MTSSVERMKAYREVMADPILKKEYLDKVRKKIADKMAEEEREFFSDLPVGATHYLTWEYGYKSFYKLAESNWYLWVGGNKWNQCDLSKHTPWEIPEQYLK